MDFGPDGMLYIAAGDGGSGGDPGNRAQDVGQLLGKILRIDVDEDDFPADPDRNYAVPAGNPFASGGGAGEIWAYGLRNPWRNSFDALTGDLYIADVGQNTREEINFQPAATGGSNYGWKVMEGTLCFNDSVASNPPCFDAALEPPIHEYGHGGAPDGGFSVTGGFVYRGPIASLQGLYFFADFVSDQIWSFRFNGMDLSEFTNWTQQLSPNLGSLNNIVSFAEDALLNLYLVDLDGGLYKFSTASHQCSGSIVVLMDRVFAPTTITACEATHSITAGPGVVVETGADLSFNAQTVVLRPGFEAQNGSAFRATTFSYIVP